MCYTHQPRLWSNLHGWNESPSVIFRVTFWFIIIILFRLKIYVTEFTLKPSGDDITLSWGLNLVLRFFPLLVFLNLSMLSLRLFLIFVTFLNTLESTEKLSSILIGDWIFLVFLFSKMSYDICQCRFTQMYFVN